MPASHYVLTESCGCQTHTVQHHPHPHPPKSWKHECQRHRFDTLTQLEVQLKISYKELCERVQARMHEVLPRGGDTNDPQLLELLEKSNRAKRNHYQTQQQLRSLSLSGFVPAVVPVVVPVVVPTVPEISIPVDDKEVRPVEIEIHPPVVQ